MTSRRWSAGDAIALREIWRGRIWTARAVTVVEDADEHTMFHVPAGMSWKRPIDARGERLRLPTEKWRLTDDVWEEKHVLSFAWPGLAYAILAFWSDPGDEFLGWYVNLQTPLRRTAIGFDYMDHTLDVVVSPDRSTWEWKDEDELAEAVALGLFSSERAATIRAEGERALERVRTRASPFDRDWESWRPDPSWPMPELPPGWDAVEAY